MNLEIGEANIYKDETEISETRDSDAAVIKSIVGYSSTLKNRCIAYMDSPESDFSYEQLSELVKAYRVYSRSCGDIVRLIYEFYDYDVIEACEKTVDITRDNYSEHIAAAKDAVDARLDECRERYNKTFYTEDEEEYAKILLEVRTERRSLEELLRLFESLNSSFETYFNRLDSEGMDIPVVSAAEDPEADGSGERTFNISDYPIEEDEYPAADTVEESAEETEKISERSSTLEDILAEFAEDEDYAERYEKIGEDDGDDYDYEYDYSEAYSLYTEGESDEAYENYSFKAETEEAEEVTEESEEIAEEEEAEENGGLAEEEPEEYYEEQEQEQIEFGLPELPSETDLSSEEDIPDNEAEKSDEEKFVDFIENSRFETYKAVFETNGDIRREINVTTIAESGFTKLHGKDKWSENSYINDVFGIYRQYTSISADDSEIRRSIIRAGALKKISDFLISIGIEESAENIMQLDKLCPIEFSAPDAAVIETDSSYILAVFKAVYDYLQGDRSAPIAIVAAEKKKEEPESYAEEKFFGFGSGEDYEDYETSKYVAADYEAAAREMEDREDSPNAEDTEENIPENNSDNSLDSFESGVAERAEETYEQYTEPEPEPKPEPEPIKEIGTPVTMILNGKEAVYESWAEAERAFCEYAIKAKPFAMALINRRNDILNGQKIFNRATYDIPNTISLSNGLQAYSAVCREDFLEICGRVTNICSIEKDIYKIIESGAVGNVEL